MGPASNAIARGIRRRQKSIAWGIRLRLELASRVADAARAEGVSLNEVIRRAIIYWLENQEVQKA